LTKFSFVLISLIVFFISEYVIFNCPVSSFYSFIVALTGILLFLQISYKLHTSSTYFSKLLSSIGKYSFEIYILHILVTAGMRILLNNFWGIQNMIVHILSGTLCGILIPFAAAYLFNRHKWFKVIFRLT
jgi:peptidoglycan/LPS O-acetylase OafA/YrhL